MSEEHPQEPPQGRRKPKRASYLPDIHRSLPQSEDAEKGALCSALLSPGNVLLEMADRLPEESFYHPAHQIIRRAMLELEVNGKPVEFIGLTQLLKDKGELEKAGGAADISDLFTFVPTASNADYYIDIVREKFLLRQLIQTCTEFAGRAYDEQGEVRTLLEDAQQRIFKLGAADGRVIRRSLHDIVSDRQREIKQGKVEEIRGISTGFKNLDEKRARLTPGGLIIPAGDISDGKSAFLWNVVHNVSVLQAYPSLVISAEMTAAECADYAIEIGSGCNTDSVMERLVSDEAREAYFEAGRVFSRAPVEIYGSEDCEGMVLERLVSLIRQAKAKNPKLRLIGLDYDEHFIPDPIPKHTTKEIELTRLSRGLKRLAGELKDVTILLVSQFTDGKLSHARGKAKDATQLWTMKADGEHRTMTLGKNRFAKRDQTLEFIFTGANKRWRAVEEGPPEN